MKKIILLTAVALIGLNSFGQLRLNWLETDSTNTDKLVLDGQEMDNDSILHSQKSDTANIALNLDAYFTDSMNITGIIKTPFESESFANPITIDFSTRNFKIIDITGDLTINISSLPEGVSTLIINQDGTGRTITIGTGWGSVADNQVLLSTTADAKNIVQFINDGTDITYFVVTEGN